MSKLKITIQPGKQVSFSTNPWSDTPNALLSTPDIYGQGNSFPLMPI